MCGIMSPTKPMSPATDTAAAVSSDADGEREQLEALDRQAELARPLVAEQHEVELARA